MCMLKKICTLKSIGVFQKLHEPGHDVTTRELARVKELLQMDMN